MLTRVFWLLEEQTRYSLKPLLNQYLLPTPSAFAGLDYRLGRDIVRPQCDVVLASLGKGLVHHARLSPQLDRFEMSAAIGWGLVLSS